MRLGCERTMAFGAVDTKEMNLEHGTIMFHLLSLLHSLGPSLEVKDGLVDASELFECLPVDGVCCLVADECVWLAAGCLGGFVVDVAIKSLQDVESGVDFAARRGVVRLHRRVTV